MTYTTYEASVAHHVATQARDAIANGMGMEEFFRWAVGYTLSVAGVDDKPAEAMTIAAWTAAFDEKRDEEISQLSR
jgi:hypothetical protein